MEDGEKSPDRDVPTYSDKRPPDCHTCSSDGKRFTVEGYCQTRNDYLCETCYKLHNIPNPDDTLQHVISSELDFKTASVTILPDINTRTTSDNCNSSLTGLTLLYPNTLLAADYSNCTLKEIDVTTNTVISQLFFACKPWDITLLPGDQAALTLPNDKMIQFISTNGRLSCLRAISVSDECYGISSVDTTLVVSYRYPAKIEIMDFTCTVINIINTDNNGHIMFKDPAYITVVREKSEEMIYVSNRDANAITKVSVKGKVLGTYKHKNWDRIAGLTCVGDGQILVCNLGGNSVDVVSTDEKDIVTLIDSTHGLEIPRTLCYCPSHAALYVSTYIDNYPICVFNFSNK